MEKSYKYFSGHHKNIKKLEGRVGNPRHAIVLDKFAFLSINSNFALIDRPNENGWFCVEYKQLGEMTGYKERTIKAIVKNFESLGLIEKIRKIVNNNCRACIRITDKTKSILDISTPCGKEQGISLNNDTGLTKNSSEQKKLPGKCTFESSKNAPAYNEEKKKTEDINIITRSSRDNKAAKNVPIAVSEMFLKVGERLTHQQKNQIYGAICNLQRQSCKTISNPAEFFAWIAFSILNSEHQLKGCSTFQEKLNTIMKIARSPGGFSKPRGFHNHWDIGKSLKAQEKSRLEAHELSKKGGESSTSCSKSIEITPAFSDTKPISSFEARKVKDIWQDESKIRRLKSKRAELMVKINALFSDTKALSILFADDIATQESMRTKNNQHMLDIQAEIARIDDDITTHQDKKSSTQDMQWQALYEAG